MQVESPEIRIIRTLPQNFIEANIERICSAIFGVDIRSNNNVSVSFLETGGFQYSTISSNGSNSGSVFKDASDVADVLNKLFIQKNEVIAAMLATSDGKFNSPFFPLDYMKLASVLPKYRTGKDGEEIELWNVTYKIEISAFDNLKKKKQKSANLANGGIKATLSANGELIGLKYNILPLESNKTSKLYSIVSKEAEAIPQLVYLQNKETNWVAPFYASSSKVGFIPATKESMLPLERPQEKSGVRILFITQAPKEDPVTISDMIEMLKEEEEKFREEEWNHNRWMVTRLRKIFYGSLGWDRFLIKGVDKIKSSYGDPKRIERGRKKVRIAYYPEIIEFDLVDYEYYPVDANGNKPRIYLKQQDVGLEYGSHKGIRIDIGHTLAGLDALNNPNSVYAIDMLKLGIDRNVDAVTWIGDLGSVLAEVQVKYLNGGKKDLSDHEINEVIYGKDDEDGFAPPQDMLGNIDAYAIYARYDNELKSTKSSIRISEILREYYLGSATDFQDQRYSYFAKSNGIKLDEQGNIINKEERIAYFTGQIQESAALYIAASSEGFPVSRAFFSVGISFNKFANILAKSFIRSLEIAIQTE